jgi:hypothetical protein
MSITQPWSAGQARGRFILLTRSTPRTVGQRSTCDGNGDRCARRDFCGGGPVAGYSRRIGGGHELRKKPVVGQVTQQMTRADFGISLNGPRVSTTRDGLGRSKRAAQPVFRGALQGRDVPPKLHTHSRRGPLAGCHKRIGCVGSFTRPWGRRHTLPIPGYVGRSPRVVRDHAHDGPFHRPFFAAATANVLKNDQSLAVKSCVEHFEHQRRFVPLGECARKLAARAIQKTSADEGDIERTWIVHFGPRSNVRDTSRQGITAGRRVIHRRIRCDVAVVAERKSQRRAIRRRDT